ncbi:hypothetical protein T440DRAFT_507098 [Plenodomus tracheiphilus IPT5]|uniref:Uncharacterized protein n=1 Tax=Plenodomus tracheiphilus IPT5 TaxID=1408161 RepID=A0A6A7BBF2_9PLEO|nr:hypothetical protein T440DRAFT_507098 [Plenodomus tracheiphilus IPT5]
MAPTKPQTFWRNLSLHDLNSLMHIANTIHTTLPERPDVFTERILLFPQGCLALIKTSTNELGGYIISHPICHRQPPALDSLLGEIPHDANQYYIHDVAILPEFRGCGAAREGIVRVLAVGERFDTMALVSVYGMGSFWGRFDFCGELGMRGWLGK